MLWKNLKGEKIPIYGGGTIGLITNEHLGCAEDQVGVACVWFDEDCCDIFTEIVLSGDEEKIGIQLGKYSKTLLGAGLQGDYICSPTSQFIGDKIGKQSAFGYRVGCKFK